MVSKKSGGNLVIPHKKSFSPENLSKSGIKPKHKSLFHPIDLFLLLLIVLNIIDFFEIIPVALDFAKKILSWSLLGYLLFKVSPSHVIFGDKNKSFDSVLIFSWFLLSVNLLVSYASSVVLKSGFLGGFFSFIIKYHQIIEESGFVIGLFSLICFAIYSSFAVKFEKRSIMGVFHEDHTISKSFSVTFLRFVVSVVVFFGFYLFIFKLMMEWLAIAIDAPLLLAALLFYTFFVIRHKVTSHIFLEKVGSVGSDFYSHFIDRFRYKESFFLGVVGLLILHIITDIGNFIVPYITGFYDQLYFSSLGLGHDSVWIVLIRDFSFLSSFFQKFVYVIVFLLNIFGFVLLFVSPAIIWFFLAHRRKPHLPKFLMVLFFSSIPAMILSPLFIIRKLNTSNLIGVDVLTSSILFNKVQINLSFVLMVSLVFFLLGFFVHRSRRSQDHFLRFSWVSISVVFIGFYVFFYFSDIAIYYFDIILGSLHAEDYILFFTFVLFEFLTGVFYIGGFLLLLYELVHRPNHHSKK